MQDMDQHNEYTQHVQQILHVHLWSAVDTLVFKGGAKKCTLAPIFRNMSRQLAWVQFVRDKQVPWTGVTQ